MFARRPAPQHANRDVHITKYTKSASKKWETPRTSAVWGFAMSIAKRTRTCRAQVMVKIGWTAPPSTFREYPNLPSALAVIAVTHDTLLAARESG